MRLSLVLCLAFVASLFFIFFFFNDTATTEIYTLSLHDALPIYALGGDFVGEGLGEAEEPRARGGGEDEPRERLFRSHRGEADDAPPLELAHDRHGGAG